MTNQSSDVVVVGVPARVAWQLQLFVGLVTVVLGFILALAPSSSLNVICLFLGALIIVGGVFHAIRALDQSEAHRAWLGVVAVLQVVLGVLVMRHLGASKAVVGVLIGLSWILQGLVGLLIAAVAKGVPGRGWTTFFGLLSLVAGIVVVCVPIKSVHFLAVLTGIWFFALGVLEITAGLMLRSALKR